MSGYLIRQAPSYAGGTKGWEGVVDVRGKPGKFDWCDPRWKTCHKKPAASNLNVRLLFVRISTNLGGLEKSCCFPVLGELCWTVHKHVLLFSFFWVFLSEGLLCSPLCNGSTGQGMVIGDWEIVDKMTRGGTNSATYTMRQDLRGTDVTTNQCVVYNVPVCAEPYKYCIYSLGSSSSIIHDDHRRCRDSPQEPWKLEFGQFWGN